MVSFLRHDGRYPARWNQNEGLDQLEKSWDDADIHSIRAGPGSGKSFISVVMQKSLKGKKTAILTPNNDLVRQYKTDYPHLNVLIGKVHYTCNDIDYTGDTRAELNCADINERRKSYCNNCKYLEAKHRSYRTDTVFNVYSYIASITDFMSGEIDNELRADYVILDEAEKCIEMLMEQCTITVNLKDYPIKEIDLVDADKIAEYLREVARDHELLAKELDDKEFKKRGQLKRKAERLFFMAVIIENDFDKYSIGIIRRKRSKILELKPITLPKTVANKILGKKKTIMLSASIFKEDVLEVYSNQNMDINELTFKTCIPAYNRSLFVLRGVYNGVKAKEFPIDQLAKVLLGIAKYCKKKNVLVHTTYGKMEDIADGIYAINPKALVYTHTRETKEDTIKLWKETGGIFLGAGVDTGLDLKDGACRVNIIPQIRYPYLGDPWVEKRKNWANGDRWYTLQALKYVIQAAGRGVRHEKDWCVNICLDPNINTIVNILQKRYNIEIPETFLETLNLFATHVDVKEYLDTFSEVK